MGIGEVQTAQLVESSLAIAAEELAGLAICVQLDILMHAARRVRHAQRRAAMAARSDRREYWRWHWSRYTASWRLGVANYPAPGQHW